MTNKHLNLKLSESFTQAAAKDKNFSIRAYKCIQNRESSCVERSSLITNLLKKTN